MDVAIRASDHTSIRVSIPYLISSLGRDALQLRRRTDKTTYWTTKVATENVRSYLRQF
jgi:hypothetical protein